MRFVFAMTHNPYSPPASQLPTPEPSHRPRSVVVSVWLLGASYVIGTFNVLRKMGLPHNTPSLIGMVIGFLLVTALVLAIYFRKNWCRWVMVALVAVEVAFLARALLRTTEITHLLVPLTQLALQLVAAILLVLPPASHWYRPRRPTQREPLREPA